MTPKAFDTVARLVRRQCGLVLTPDKAYLVESRLAAVARRRGAASVDDFVAALAISPTSEMERDVVEAMVTHETFFFRDKKPFEQFRDVVLPHLLRTRAARRSFRIWCAASSSGQEPFSLAMLLDDAMAQLAGWRTEIVATDISQEVLRQARMATYTEFEVRRGLPTHYLARHFIRVGSDWELVPAIRAKVDFREFNLLDSPRPLGTFDVVFCRNVLIYFDRETKAATLDRIATVTAPDGFLFLGGAETLLGLTNAFESLPGQRGLYGRRGAANERAALKSA